MTGPLFIVAPPGSGGALLLDAFRSTPGVVTQSGRVDDAIRSVLGPRERLSASDATDAVAERVRALCDRGSARLVDLSPHHLARVPFLHALFPGAIFVYVYRDPRRAILEGAASGLTIAELARDWAAATTLALDDLEALPPGAWLVTNYHELTHEPAVAVERIARFAEIPWDGALPRVPATAGDPPPTTIAELDAAEASMRAAAERARALLASPPPRVGISPGAKPPMTSPVSLDFSSVSTESFPAILAELGITLAVSTYQSGRLIFLRAERPNALNTHFRFFDSPMGLAVGEGRLSIGTARTVWDYRNVPAVAPHVEPAGKHDACFVPRRMHVTGDIRIHEIGFAAGELWVVNTRFSTLCTLDPDSSFVPRWRPPFVTHLAAEDRCHLNGMAIVGDRVRYVTALGTTNTAGGWRERKATGGVLLDVDTGEPILTGLSMPHSPRQRGDRFLILESGKGTIATADLASGRVDTIAELPGFTRGLAFAGPFAFVGLSQVRESNIFGGIPLTERVAERECGVYAIDLRTGRVAAFLRFSGDVREIFDVQVVPMRYPELLEPDSPLVATSFVLPEESMSAVTPRE